MTHGVGVWLTGPSAVTAICRTQWATEDILGQERGSKDTPGSSVGTLSNNIGVGQLSQLWEHVQECPLRSPQWLNPTSLCSFPPSTPHSIPCSPNTLLPQPNLSTQPPTALPIALSLHLGSSPHTFKTELWYPLSQEALLLPTLLSQMLCSVHCIR